MKSTGIEKASMENAIRQILDRVAELYDSYSDNTKVLSEKKRKDIKEQNDKREKKMMSDLQKLQAKMVNVITDMSKSQALKKPQFKGCEGLMKKCLQDIQTMNKMKIPLFKVESQMEQLVKSTDQDVDEIRKNLGIAGESKFLCCGTDGVKKFMKVIQKFKMSAYAWQILVNLKPKDSVETFVSPKFSSREYDFIRQILGKFWPQKSVEQRIVQKYVERVETGKPSKLVQANQFLFGINRDQNLYEGLRIYKQQAQKLGSDGAAACAFLGQAYEQGILLPKNLQKSTQYYSKAMSANHPYAFYRYAMALIRGTLDPKGVNQKQLKLGFNLLKQVADGENNLKQSPEAQVELGHYFQKGQFAADTQGLFKTSVNVQKAIEYYEKARAQKVPKASNNLGVLYITRKQQKLSRQSQSLSKQQNSRKNEQKGVQYLRQAQNYGFLEAFYNLGYLYQNSMVGRKDLQQALNNYYKGGLKGDIQSRLKFAYQLMNQTSIHKEQYDDHYRLCHSWLQSIIRRPETIDLAQASARRVPIPTNQQKAQALFYLGLMHEHGFGVQRNPKQAFAYFSEASQMGSSAAKNKVGDCYFSGYGVRENRQLALGCYLGAEAEGNSDAMVNLGTIYLNGIAGLVPQNYSQAYQYFCKALQLQNSNAMIHLSYMYKHRLGGLNANGDDQGITPKKLLEEAASSNNPLALYMLKEMDNDYDDRVQINSINEGFYNTPQRINLQETVPIISQARF